jgi:predicted acylesterase/phospholipase RssA
VRFSPSFLESSKPTPSLRLVIGGGGSELELIRGMIEQVARYADNRNFKFTGADGTSAGAIAASLFVSGYNEADPENRVENGLRRLKNFCEDLRGLGWHHTLARNNLAFWFLSPNDRSRLWANNLLLINDFRRAVGMASPVQDELKKLLKKYIPNIQSLQQGEMDITINTMSHDPKTGERIHHIHQAKDIDYDTIIASTALANLGAKFLNGVNHFDGGHMKNGFLESALADNSVTDIIVFSSYPTHHQTENGTVKQGELHHDSFRAYMDDRNTKHLHGLSPIVSEANDIDRMRNDPVWMAERYQRGVTLGRLWCETHGAKIGQTSSYEFPESLMNQVLSIPDNRLVA